METPNFNDDMLGEQQKKYTPKDENAIQTDVIAKENRLNDLFSKVGKLKPYWDDFKTIFAMIKDWISGDYREVPFKTIASLAGALLYVLSPLDLIADIIPGIGFADDVAVFVFVMKIAKSDVEKYRAWKATQK